MHRQDNYSTNILINQPSVEQARLQFLYNGYDPIPLRPQTKIPVAKRWQNLSTLYQWEKAEPRSNIGLRAGNGKAFIDCDDKNNPQTTENVTRWLNSLGIHDYPRVQTPSNGNHIYVEIDSELAGSSRNLLPDMGTGEFRYGKGAQVGTFPSVTDAGHYVLISGDIARLPKLSRTDIAGIVSGQVETRKQPHMTALAYAVANGQPGVLQGRYKGDRSAAEAGLVLSLINTGHTFEQIKRIFDTYPCMGHYQEHRAVSEKESNRWLWLTYQNELAYSNSESPIRRMIAGVIAGTRLSAWKNANQKQVYLAHLERAYKAGRTEYSMSVRDTALSARVGYESARNQTKKLIAEGLLENVDRVQGTNTFRINAAKTVISYNPPCEDMTNNAVLNSDAFRNGGGKVKRLGKRAGEIYSLLLQQPLTIAEIVKRVGCSRDTVERALKKMSYMVDRKTGEVIEMVSRDGNVWYANKVDLKLVSMLVGAYRATEKQEIQYEKDRRAHREALAKTMRDKQIEQIEESVK